MIMMIVSRKTDAKAKHGTSHVWQKMEIKMSRSKQLVITSPLQCRYRTPYGGCRVGTEKCMYDRNNVTECPSRFSFPEYCPLKDEVVKNFLDDIENLTGGPSIGMTPKQYNEILAKLSEVSR